MNSFKIFAVAAVCFVSSTAGASPEKIKELYQDLETQLLASQDACIEKLVTQSRAQILVFNKKLEALLAERKRIDQRLASRSDARVFLSQFSPLETAQDKRNKVQARINELVSSYRETIDQNEHRYTWGSRVFSTALHSMTKPLAELPVLIRQNLKASKFCADPAEIEKSAAIADQIAELAQALKKRERKKLPKLVAAQRAQLRADYLTRFVSASRVNNAVVNQCYSNASFIAGIAAAEKLVSLGVHKEALRGLLPITGVQDAACGLGVRY